MTTSDETRQLPGSAPGETPKRFYAELYNQWSGMFSGRNHWYDLTLIKLAGEYAPYKGSYELEVSILGLCWTFTYVYDHTFTKRLKKMVDEIDAESKPHTSPTPVDK